MAGLRGDESNRPGTEVDVAPVEPIASPPCIPVVACETTATPRLRATHVSDVNHHATLTSTYGSQARTELIRREVEAGRLRDLAGGGHAVAHVRPALALAADVRGAARSLAGARLKR